MDSHPKQNEKPVIGAPFSAYGVRPIYQPLLRLKAFLTTEAAFIRCIIKKSSVSLWITS
jgi:hypothetical protein